MRGFNLNKTLYHWSKKKPTALQLKYIYKMADVNSEKNILDISQFLHKELSIRLSQRVYNLFNLPYGLPLVPEIKNVINLYTDSFTKIQKMSVPTCKSSINDFTLLVKDIKDSHNLLEEIISNAVQNISNPFIDFDLINHELDTFFISRIGIRTLISQQIEIVLHNNSIIKDCNINTIMNDSINNVTEMSIQNRYEEPPNFILNNNTKNTLKYIPTHLFYIFNEVLKNSVVAQHKNSCIDPIKIDLHEGDKDFIIKITDNGLGFSYPDLKKALSYSYSTCPKVDSIRGQSVPMMAGLGFGLPLAKQYCNYLGDEMCINPIEGMGTEVFIYLNKTGKQVEKII